MKATMSRFVAALAFAVLGAGIAQSQNVTGSIAGVVSDPSGGIVPSITVQAINEGTGARFQTTADSDGQYTIRAVPIGCIASPQRRRDSSALRRAAYVCR